MPNDPFSSLILPANDVLQMQELHKKEEKKRAETWIKQFAETLGKDFNKHMVQNGFFQLTGKLFKECNCDIFPMSQYAWDHFTDLFIKGMETKGYTVGFYLHYENLVEDFDVIRDQEQVIAEVSLP